MSRFICSLKKLPVIFGILLIILYHVHLDRRHMQTQTKISNFNNQIEKLKLQQQNSHGLEEPFFPPVRHLPTSQRKRILITGGAGFIGSHLTDRLLQDGHEVIVLDNLYTGSRRNIEQWIGHRNFEFIHHDVTNPIYLEVDEIYHLASPASPRNYMKNPVKTLKTNLLGTLNILGLAKRTKAKFLLASTSEVYGDPEVHPQVESYVGHVNPVGPRSCYDEGKRAAESLSYAYFHQSQVPVRIARIFNTYGPRMQLDDGRVISNFIVQSLRNESLTIYGSGKQTRSFQYVSDLVTALIYLMTSNYSGPVNLGNPREYTILQLTELIDELIEGPVKLTFSPLLQDDPQRRRPDISLAKSLLPWEPVVDLKEGLHLTISYFRKSLLS